jgi:hypothetical protein
MSRTVKRKGFAHFRRPKTQQQRIVEIAALEELIEAGITPSNRLRNRASLSGSIPTSYDDLNFSTYSRWYA